VDYPEQEKLEKGLRLMREKLCILENLTVGYTFPRRPIHVVARNLEITLYAGELTCLLGPNGSGKSTLLRTVSGMQQPIGGRILLGGKELKSYGQRELSMLLSIVLTDRIDVGFLSSYALVALGRHPYTGWSGRITGEDDRVVRWALEAVGAGDLGGRFVTELSDGERQKILIARALAQEPRIMLLDEPTAFLDVPRRVEIMQLLRSLARETGRAVILSTHDLELALRSADRICLLSMEGRLFTGSPEDLVLSGAFEETFHSEGVRFDREYGHFTLVEGSGREVSLSGKGSGAHWTRRALEREGYSIVSQGGTAEATVCVARTGSGWHWESSIGGRSAGHDSIEELLHRFRREFK
jgi:iron complex transport system ATP-binding protein